MASSKPPGRPRAANHLKKVDYIEAFLNACTGGDLPVRYPRTGANLTGSKVYYWFVKNEGRGKGRRCALPALAERNRGLR